MDITPGDLLQVGAVTLFDIEKEGGLEPSRRSRRERPQDRGCDQRSVVTSFSGWTFAQASPRQERPPVGHPAGVGHRYSCPGDPLDLHAFVVPSDPIVAWIRDRAAQLTDASDRARVMRGAQRSVVSASVTDLLLIDARHPRILKEARVMRADLDADDPRARRRIADVARRIPGVGGLRVPPTPGGEADGVVVFAPYVPQHVTFVHHRVESVEPLVMRALRGTRPVAGSRVATIIDFEAARREREGTDKAGKQTASNSQLRRSD